MGTMAAASSTTFPCGVSAVPGARRFARDVLHQRDVAEGTTETVILLVSELVTNAIVHAASPVELTMRVAPRMVTVGVRDSDPRLPTVVRDKKAVRDKAAAGDEAGGGLGLLILDELTHDWVVEEEPDGKIVWFSVARTHERPAASRRSTAQRVPA